MKFRYIGQSGLRVSPICLGTMTFGTQCDREEAFRIMDQAVEAGINFFDTAEIYPVPPTAELTGLTEEIIGDWLKDRGKRDSLILATKVTGSSAGWFVPPVRHSLTALDRHHIRIAVEGSLRRLQTDYIDLYQTHWPDPMVPVEETMEVLDELIQEGKIRYLGTSNDTAYGLTKANYLATGNGLHRYEAIQNHFSLLNQRFLDELAEVCRREKISLLPYSPLAGGVLSGKYKDGFPEKGRFSRYQNQSSERHRRQINRFLNERARESVIQYLEIAEKYAVNPTTMAIAWSMHHDFVASTIIGATKAEQLKDILPAFDYEISPEMLDDLSAVHESTPYPMEYFPEGMS